MDIPYAEGALPLEKYKDDFFSYANQDCDPTYLDCFLNDSPTCADSTTINDAAKIGFNGPTTLETLQATFKQDEFVGWGDPADSTTAR